MITRINHFRQHFPHHFWRQLFSNLKLKAAAFETWGNHPPIQHQKRTRKRQRISKVMLSVMVILMRWNILQDHISSSSIITHMFLYMINNSSCWRHLRLSISTQPITFQATASGPAGAWLYCVEQWDRGGPQARPSRALHGPSPRCVLLDFAPPRATCRLQSGKEKQKAFLSQKKRV